MEGSFRTSRRRGAAIVLVLALALLSLAAWRLAALRMPGESFEGRAEPTAAERTLAAQLERDVRALAVEIGERHERRYAALLRARDHVERRMREVGLEPRLEPYEVHGLRFDNVVAEVGRGDRTRLLGAHYDTAIGSPGANDNATGVAVLLALAERLAARPPGLRVRLVAFTNEEPPHFGRDTMGSRVHARGDLPDEAIVLDSLGCYAGTQRYPSFWHALAFGERGDFVALVGDDRSEPLLRRSVAAFRRRARVRSEGAVLSPRTQGAAWSDHASFWARNVPAILVTDTAAFRDPHYHRPTDDGRQVDFVALARLVDGLEAVARGTTR